MWRFRVEAGSYNPSWDLVTMSLSCVICVLFLDIKLFHDVSDQC